MWMAEPRSGLGWVWAERTRVLGLIGWCCDEDDDAGREREEAVWVWARQPWPQVTLLAGQE